MKKKLTVVLICVFWGLNIYSQDNVNKDIARDAPEWISHGIMYQIWPRSFTVEGTLSAATKKLPEIAALGATIVYLCPVMLQDRDINREFWSPRQKASPANNPRNPYRIMDYTKVDPEYGTEEDLKEFIETAHYLGLRVIMELVLTHTGPSHVFTQNPEYYIRDENGNIIINIWGFNDLNFENKELREILLKTLEEWIRKFDLDGWRCDLAGKIPVDFWEEARRRMEKIKPDIGMLAEAANPVLHLKAFDVSYNQVDRGWLPSLKRVFVDGVPANDLEEGWKFWNQRFPKGALFLRWIDSHDDFRSEIVFSKKGSMAANVLNFTIDGVPFIYNGQEIGDASPYGVMYYPEKSYNNNGAINWNAQFIPHQRELRNWYKKLIALRKSENALLEGETLWLKTDNPESAVAFLRKTDNECIIVVINVSNRKIKVDVELQDSKNNKEISPETLFSSDKDEITNLTRQNVTLSLGSFGYYVGNLKIQIEFFKPVLIPAIRQKLFNHGQFGLTPVKNIFHLLSFGHKMPSDFLFLS